MKHLKHILFTLFFFVLTVQLVQATVIYLEQPSYSQETSTEFCFSNAERRWLGLLYVEGNFTFGIFSTGSSLSSIDYVFDDYPDLIDSWKVLSDVSHDVRLNTNLLEKVSKLSPELQHKVGDLYKNLQAPAGYKGKVNFPVTKNIEGKSITVRYDKDGFPDFTKHSPGKNYMFESNALAGKGTDMTAANNWAKNKFGTEKVQPMPNGKIKIDGVEHTWHHHQDGKSMFPVPSEIHNATGGGFGHSGGAAIIDRGLQGLFESPIF